MPGYALAQKLKDRCWDWRQVARNAISFDIECHLSLVRKKRHRQSCRVILDVTCLLLQRQGSSNQVHPDVYQDRWWNIRYCLWRTVIDIGMSAGLCPILIWLWSRDESARAIDWRGRLPGPQPWCDPCSLRWRLCKVDYEHLRIQEVFEP